MKELQTLIISAFCGTGKTYLCNNFADIYQEIECWEYRGKDFPNNYIQKILDALGKTKYLFISTDPIVLRRLNELGIKIRLFYPQNELRDEYLNRYIARDAPYDFIGTMMKNWNIWLDELKEQNYCKHTILQRGQYISTILPF